MQDTQCGFKGFRRAAARDLFAMQRVTSIVFDVELIYLARRRGYRIAIVPIQWSDRRGSRMRRTARPRGARGVRPPADPAAAPPSRAPARRGPLTVWHRVLPVLAVVTFILTTGAIVASAGDALGYDYRAYAAAAQRLLDGQPLYDATVDVAGPFAIYLYPPPFALAFVPFALLPDAVGVWAWTGACIAMVLGAIALMPVGRDVRWGVLLLAAIDWPVLYSIKLGQVGPLLLILFAAGWRWLDRPDRLGVTIGLGVLVKLQPGLLVVWALLAGRSRAAGVAVALVAVVALASLLFVGTGAWLDYPSLLGRVNEPVTTPHNMTLGAVLYRAGWSLDLASVAQLGWTAVMLGLALLASWRRAADASYLVVVVATQALSPLLWDHYAIVLLLPVAWLLERRQWWAVLLVLATSLPLIGVSPPIVYPIVFAASVVALFLLGDRRSSGTAPGSTIAAGVPA